MTISTRQSTLSYGGNPVVASLATVVASRGGARPVAGPGWDAAARLEAGLTPGSEDGHNTSTQGGGADPGP